jgi:ATP-dependent helicase IRC3
MIQLRPYQKAAIEAVCTAYDQGCQRQILSIPTGGGKTIVFSALYESLKSRLPGKMLIITNGEELVDQAIQTMRAVNPSLRIDKEMAEHRADPANADAIVASVASLGRKNTPRLQKYNWEEWDKIVIDEVQHSTATSYLNILNAVGILNENTSKLL